MPQTPYALPALLLAIGCGGGEATVPPPCAATPVLATPAIQPIATSSAASSAATPTAAPAPAATPISDGIAIELKNPTGAPRTAEIVVIRLSEVQQLLPSLSAAKTIVQDASGAPVLSQLVDNDGDDKPDELVFQADFAANESKRFLLGEGTRSAPGREQFHVYGRFVRERHDDFAWENDRTAHRAYGPGLETDKKEPLVSSGIDVWSKRTRRLVVNDWYQSNDYHRDNGDGGDFYSVGPSRGCGGIGIWDGKALHVSRNFTTSRVLANGPIRLIFELSYGPWDAGGGAKVAETKRVIVDQGQYFDRVESTFKIQGKPGKLALAIGVAKHKGAAFENDLQSGTLSTWELSDNDSGHTGCAVVNGSGAASGFAENASERLLLAALSEGTATVYFVGSAWDRSGDVPDAVAWSKLVAERLNRQHNPIRVALTRSPSSAPPSTGNPK